MAAGGGGVYCDIAWRPKWRIILVEGGMFHDGPSRAAEGDVIKNRENRSKDVWRSR